MKQLESTYDRAVAAPPRNDLQNKGVAIAVFFAIAIGTFLAVSAVSSLNKYGVFNVLLIVGALMGVFIVMLALPLLGENYRYLRARVNYWHFVWYLVYISSLVFRIRNLADFKAEPIDSWALLRIGPELFIGLYLMFLLATRRLNWVKSLFTGIPRVLALYSIFCVLSSTWSIFPPFTFYKSAEFMLDVSVMSVLLCVITRAEQYKTLMDFTWTVYGIETVWCWMQIAIWPSEALDEGRLKGVFPLTAYNALGEYGAILAIVAFCRLIPIAKGTFERSWYMALMGLGLATMIIAETRNAVGGLALAAVVVLVLSRGFTGALLAGVGGAGVVFTALGAILEKFMKRGQSEDALNSLSGRMEWWHYAWLFFLQHPIAGMGAYAAGKFAVMQTLNVNSGSTHSDYIELLVGTGIIGITLFSVAILWTFRCLFSFVRDASFSPLERQLALEAAGVMTVLFVHSFFNVELIWHAPLFFLVVLGYAEFLRRRKYHVLVPRLQ